jgi:hypothetical protein
MRVSVGMAKTRLCLATKDTMLAVLEAQGTHARRRLPMMAWRAEASWETTQPAGMEAEVRMTKERTELTARLASMLVYDWSRGPDNLYRVFAEFWHVIGGQHVTCAIHPHPSAERIVSLRDQSADLFKFVVVINNAGHNQDCDVDVSMRVSGVRCIFVYRFLANLSGMPAQSSCCPHSPTHSPHSGYHARTFSVRGEALGGHGRGCPALRARARARGQ